MPAKNGRKGVGRRGGQGGGGGGTGREGAWTGGIQSLLPSPYAPTFLPMRQIHGGTEVYHGRPGGTPVK